MRRDISGSIRWRREIERYAEMKMRTTNRAVMPNIQLTALHIHYWTFFVIFKDIM